MEVIMENKDIFIEKATQELGGSYITRLEATLLYESYKYWCKKRGSMRRIKKLMFIISKVIDNANKRQNIKNDVRNV